MNLFNEFVLFFSGETRLKEERFMEFVDVCNALKLKSMANYEYVKYVNVPDDGQSESITNETSEQQGFIDNVTIIGDDYAEIVKSVTQEESVTEDTEMLYESNPLADSGNFDIIEVIEQQTTEDESKYEPKYEPPQKRKRISTHLREGDPRYKDSLVNAMNEVIYNKVSFKMAAEKFNLSKTILWRICQQSPEYQLQKDNPGNQELNQTILEELTNGETLLGISKKYNVPVSTLHRRKTMLFEKGDLPDNVRIKQRNRGEDFPERLDQAISEVENGLSQTEASKKYRIPKTTIWRRLKRKNPLLLRDIKLEENVHECYQIIDSAARESEEFKVIATFKSDES